jgi:two-component system, chemotaxis family, chemotaxis protein CheY
LSILVVDDSRAMRMIVLRELRKAGYDTKEVVEAENGRDALEKVRAGDIHLVLSDWNMPDMNGIRFLQLLREEGNEVPFGFITSESNALVHREALDAGADFVVVKPFTADDLSDQMDKALDGQRQGDGLGAALAPKEATVATVLEELLGRAVMTAKSDPPRTQLAGAVATYRGEQEGHRMLLVAEIGVAASVGAALSRLPAGAAEDYIGEKSLPTTAQENLYEVLNVMAQVVPGYGERYGLEAVDMFGRLADHTDVALATAISWSAPAEVTVKGYPTGRIGYLPS